MNMGLGPLPSAQHRSLGWQVYEAMRENIVSLQLEPGRMVYENELAEALQVSRTPIREGIRLLVNEELLEVLPQRGTQVALISEQKVSEARFVREQLETGAFCMVARSWIPSDRREEKNALLRLIEEQRRAAESGDNVRFLTLDESFHRTILELTGNRTLLNVVSSMRGHLNRVRYLALREYLHMRPLVEEHERLLAAVETRKEEEISRLMAMHFEKLDYQVPELKRAYPQYFK
jgi:GntR family transcriptional regulator, rspAB operon transcriptional repressor